MSKDKVDVTKLVALALSAYRHWNQRCDGTDEAMKGLRECLRDDHDVSVDDLNSNPDKDKDKDEE